MEAGEKSEGGSGLSDLGPYLLGGGSFGHALWVGDMGTDAAHEEGVGKIPPKGGP